MYTPKRELKYKTLDTIPMEGVAVFHSLSAFLSSEDYLHGIPE